MRGGLTSKIVALVDVLGNLLALVLRPGQAAWLLAELDTRGTSGVSPPKANRKIERDYDRQAYKWRHLIENFFTKIRQLGRTIATRYEKTACSYAANWNLVATIIAAK